jgi:hypothetical protein
MVNTRLAAWRAGRTEEVTLPSGLTVTARRITLEDVIMSGNVPKPLLGMIDRLRSDGSIDMTNMERIVEFMPLIDHTVRMAIVEPLIIADDVWLREIDPNDAFKLKPLPEDALLLSELPAADRLALFSWLVQPAAKIAPFRAESGGAVAAAPGGEDVQQPAKRDPVPL